MVTINTLQEIVENIVELADELKAQESLSDMDYGQLLAYAESLTIIKDMCDEDEQEAVGLDFDIDARYL